MKKYVWKCEGCGNTFKADNPDQCPKCCSDDIMIIQEEGSSIPVMKILIASFVIIAIGLVWMNRDKIFPPKEGVKDGKNTIYTLDAVIDDNYFQVKGGNVDDLGIYVINSLSGDKLYSKGNKFYPCKDGDFLIRYKKQENVIFKGDTIVKNFKIKSNAHKNACVKQLQILEVYPRPSDCIYTIITNMDDNANLEVSLKKNNGFVKGKLVWKLSEINGADYFYVRIGDSDQSDKMKIPSCIVPKEVKAPEKNEVIASFNLYVSDIKKNRTQFTNMIQKYNSIIVYKGEEMQLMDFIMEIKATERNEGNVFLQSLKLKGGNVFYNSERTKIIKLKITK